MLVLFAWGGSVAAIILGAGSKSLVAYIAGGCILWKIMCEGWNFLQILLSLEFIMLSVFMVLVLVSSWEGLSVSLAFVYLSFAVCEASVGLSLLIQLVREKGSSLVSNL